MDKILKSSVATAADAELEGDDSRKTKSKNMKKILKYKKNASNEEVAHEEAGHNEEASESEEEADFESTPVEAMAPLKESKNVQFNILLSDSESEAEDA